MGGSPGAATSQNFMDGLKGGLKKYPSLKLLNDQFVVTNWNPVDAQKATAGLIAQYPHIDAIVTDYGVTALAAAKAFEQAHLPVPAIVDDCKRQRTELPFPVGQESPATAFPYYTLDGTTTYVRFAVRHGVAAYQGTPDNESPAVLPFAYADSAKGLDPKCDSDRAARCRPLLSAPPGKAQGRV